MHKYLRILDEDEIKGRLLGRMTYQFLNVLELFSL